MTSKYLLLAALALPLSACGGDTADTTTVEAPATPDPMAPVPSGTMAGDVTVDGTIAAAGSDITMMAPAAAIENIDGWIAKFGDLDFDQKTQIVTGLQTLKTQLQATPLDGAAIGQTLTLLGTETTAAAATASSSSQEGLRTLGSALTAGGQKLSGSM